MGIRVVEFQNKEEAAAAIAALGADPAGVWAMAPKAVHRVLKLKAVPLAAAIILKQEMLALGGEAALSREAFTLTTKETDVLLMGTLRQYELLLPKLRNKLFLNFSELAKEIEAVLQDYHRQRVFELDCRGKKLRLGERTLIMGILNVTPDSFSNGGLFYEAPQKALAQAQVMAAAGADIIDVGAESSRPAFKYPDYVPITAAEEQRRLFPVLDLLLENLEVPISVDTYRAETAEIALEKGAHLINDVWGFKKDPRLPEVVASFGVPVIVMHNKEDNVYEDLLGEIIASLEESVGLAEKAGVSPEKIIIDPGIGFGKDTPQDLEVLRHLRELKSLGKPILLGTSRKSVIGNILNLPPQERLEGTAATVALGIAAGAELIRVHDVKEMVRVARVADAILRPRAGGANG